ncbi:MAG: universal stress protein [Cyanobacteria bacterium P01_C01_bin.73]
MYQRALICTDFSDGVYRLTGFTDELRQAGLQQVVFFHNVPIDDVRGIPRVDQDQVESCRDRLEAAVKDAPDSITVEIQIESGRITDNILQAVETHQSDVVILGASTRNALQEQLFGSTTKELLQKTPVPLFILRPQLISAYTTEELSLRCRHLFRYFLFPYDGSASAKSIQERVLEHLEQNPSGALQKSLLLWVIDDGIREEMRAGMTPEILQEKLEAVAAALAEKSIEVLTEIREGDPCAEILQTAEHQDISAIALSSGAKGWLSWSVPSITSAILRQSWHPVLVYPTLK